LSYEEDLRKLEAIDKMMRDRRTQAQTFKKPISGRKFMSDGIFGLKLWPMGTHEEPKPQESRSFSE